MFVSISGLSITVTEDLASMSSYYYSSKTNNSQETGVVYCSVANTLTQAAIYSIAPNGSDELLKWTDPTQNSTLIKGFFTGCNPFESLLQTTLDCLYEIDCLQLLNNNVPSINQVYIYIYNSFHLDEFKFI